MLERLVLQAGEAGLRTLLALLAPADAAIILALLADVIVAHRDKMVTPLVARLAKRMPLTGTRMTVPPSETSMI